MSSLGVAAFSFSHVLGLLGNRARRHDPTTKTFFERFTAAQHRLRPLSSGDMPVKQTSFVERIG
jgi:hypothetical protein